MLQTMLLLILGSGTFEATRFDPRELSNAIEAGTSSLDDAEARLLLADVGELQALGDELGGQLVGTGPDDFEERLAELFDEEKFAAFLGGFVKLTLDMLDRPHLALLLEADLNPHAPPKPGTVGAKFVESCERLWILVDKDYSPVDWLKKHRDHIERPRVLSPDPVTIGRQLIDEVYDPAATPRMAGVSRSVVRFFARALAIRHFMITNEEPSTEYVDGLFEKSNQDVENLGSLLSSVTGGPSHGFPPIDLRMESVMRRTNQWLLRQAMQRWPEPADPTMA